MEGHFAKLGRHEAEYAGDFGHRLSGGATDRDVRGVVRESIFGQSNLSLNIPRGQCRYLTAKSTEDLLGSRPWLAASGLGSPPSMWRREIGV